MQGSSTKHSVAATATTGPFGRELSLPGRRTGRHPLVSGLGAFAAGICWDAWRSIPAQLSLAGAVVGLVLWWLSLRRSRVGGTLCLLTGILCAGSGWHHVWWNWYREDELGRYAHEPGRPVCVEVRALSGARWTPAPPPDPLRSFPPQDFTEVLVWVERLRHGAQWRPASGRVRLLLRGRLESVRPGDRLRVLAVLHRHLPPDNPGERDYSAYARSFRQLSQLYVEHPACITRLKRGGFWSWRRALGALREHAEACLCRHVDAERAPLALALLIGAREQLPDEVSETFLVTGTVHVLAISGMHVGILVYGFWWAARLSLLSRRATLLATASFVVVYAAVTGGEPPVVRAAVWVVVICLGRWLGRSGFEANHLAAAGLFVLILNPASLFHVGTQLSFIAVFVLTALGSPSQSAAPEDPLDRLVARSRPWPWRLTRSLFRAARRMTLTSGAVWCLTTPLTWHHFHLVSPGALLINPLLWLPVGVAMYSGFGVLLLADFYPPAADLCGHLCGSSLGLLQAVTDGGRGLPGDHVWFPGPPSWCVVLFYAAALLLWSFQFRRRACAAALVAWVVVALACSPAGVSRWLQTRQAVLTCTFLSVGHGGCVVLECPGGGTYVYDAGRMGGPRSALRSISGFLWSRGITRLDGLLISHADTDHYNAAPALLERFAVGRIYTPPGMLAQPDAAVGVLAQAIRAADVDSCEVRAGQTWQDTRAQVRLSVLHPPPDRLPGNDNANSLVLLVEYAGKRVLLAGDVESRGLERLLGYPPCMCDVLQAPHHGSPRSNTPDLARWSRPTWVVVSDDHRYPPELLEPTYAATGTRVLHTARDGAVQFQLRPGGVTVRNYKRPSR